MTTVTIDTSRIGELETEIGELTAAIDQTIGSNARSIQIAGRTIVRPNIRSLKRQRGAKIRELNALKLLISGVSPSFGVRIHLRPGYETPDVTINAASPAETDGA